MKDAAVAEFLERHVPRLGLSWPGLKRVQSIVRKRLRRRIAELGLSDVGAYAAHLEANREEWARFDAMCRIPISRFLRDRAVFEHLGRVLLERAAESEAQARQVVRVWSAGCASGEEPYSVALTWRFEVLPAYPRLSLDVLGTELEPALLERAERGSYPAGNLRELPERWRSEAFEPRGSSVRLRAAFREGVHFECADLRSWVAKGPFDVVLCRNLAFTYFDEASQRRVAEGIALQLCPGGVLVVGGHEKLPIDTQPMRLRCPSIYEKDR